MRPDQKTTGTNGDLPRAMVHELRNAVAPIVNAVHLIRRRIKADPELPALLAIIERQVAAIIDTLDRKIEANQPACDESAKLGRGPNHAAPNTRSDAKNRRILLADDSEAVRTSFAVVLRDFGHDVRLAADGAEALRLAEQWQPDFVVLDIHMPTTNGYEIARTLRAKYPPAVMQLVMMSGMDLDEETLVGAKRAGFDHCIDKLCAITSLDRLLRGDSKVPAPEER